MSLNNNQIRELRHFIDDKLGESKRNNEYGTHVVLTSILEKLTELERGIPRKKK